MKSIPVYKASTVVDYTYVDDEDYEFLSSFKWYLKVADRNRYGVRTKWISELKSMRYLGMHRDVLNLSGSKPIVDHLDRNGLNNQKYNLRTTDTAGNGQNRRKKKESKSLYRGITYNKRYQSWTVRIQINKMRKHIGSFKSEEEAIQALSNALDTMNLNLSWWFGVPSAKAL